VSADGTLRLADGRRLVYAEWGPPDGAPVLGFHGTPNSRLAHLGARAPAAAGVRLLLVDRPGLGRSDPRTGRTLLDWAEDVEALADRLGLGCFAVFGVSGGGPHAAACAVRLAERVTALGLVSSAAPWWDVPGLALERRSLLALARRNFGAARAVVRRQCERELAAVARDPDGWLDDWTRAAPAPDRTAIADPAVRAMYIMSVREATLDGYAHEVELLWLRPWGFEPSEIAAPTTLWHGELDAAVPVEAARRLAAAIPRCEARILPDEGHLLVHAHAEEILRSLTR